jgi:hypothetical protein
VKPIPIRTFVSSCTASSRKTFPATDIRSATIESWPLAGARNRPGKPEHDVKIPHGSESVMSVHIDPIERRFPANAFCFWRDLADAFRALVQFESYRPERHYMRGPGPKCRARYELAVASSRDVHVPGRGVSRPTTGQLEGTRRSALVSRL